MSLRATPAGPDVSAVAAHSPTVNSYLDKKHTSDGVQGERIPAECFYTCQALQNVSDKIKVDKAMDYGFLTEVPTFSLDS